MELTESRTAKKRCDFIAIIFVSIAVCVLALVWFQWDVIEIITPLLMIGYWLFIVIIVLAMIVGSAVKASDLCNDDGIMELEKKQEHWYWLSTS